MGSDPREGSNGLQLSQRHEAFSGLLWGIFVRLLKSHEIVQLYEQG